ncbi:MAG: triose-phosphate isomerase [Eubacteriales bacterium]|nr:triose-phosphate isomerase [Eubacteriales bacterium]
MRKKVVAANWKMNLTIEESIELLQKIKNHINIDTKEVVLCVPFTNIYTCKEETKNTNIHIGAENLYFEEKGAYTGEISSSMLLSLGVEYVIIGHSERRQIFNENDEMINKKVLKALSKNIYPILCCGETLEQREKNETLSIIKNQLSKDLINVTKEDAMKIIIAYEPIWAIGTGKTATSSQAEEVCKYTREIIKELYDKEVSENVRILYGGSVKASNAKEIFAKENIDGGLIGGASLTEEFIDIVKA